MYKAYNWKGDPEHTATSLLFKFFDPCQMSKEWCMPLSLNGPSAKLKK